MPLILWNVAYFWKRHKKGGIVSRWYLEGLKCFKLRPAPGFTYSRDGWAKSCPPYAVQFQPSAPISHSSPRATLAMDYGSCSLTIARGLHFCPGLALGQAQMRSQKIPGRQWELWRLCTKALFPCFAVNSMLAASTSEGGIVYPPKKGPW